MIINQNFDTGYNRELEMEIRKTARRIMDLADSLSGSSDSNALRNESQRMADLKAQRRHAYIRELESQIFGHYIDDALIESRRAA